MTSRYPLRVPVYLIVPVTLKTGTEPIKRRNMTFSPCWSSEFESVHKVSLRGQEVLLGIGESRVSSRNFGKVPGWGKKEVWMEGRLGKKSERLKGKIS